MAERTLTTLHGRFDLKDLPDAYRRWPQFPLVSISNAQRSPMADATWVATVHHGLPGDFIRPPARPSSSYLAFLGRFSPEKRPDRAIAIARRMNVRLRIAAKIDVKDLAYFRTEIEPLLDDSLIDFVGEIGEAEKSSFLGNAAALLFPIDWPEPFGLAMIEAMGCGTPVIAWNCGSVPEIVDDGVTGFIVDSEEEAIAALRRLAMLDRGTVRRVFERRFTAGIMARNYVQVYRGLIRSHGSRRALEEIA
jgi:glycosyltransferase involved in cell wall biosynthesis